MVLLLFGLMAPIFSAPKTKPQYVAIENAVLKAKPSTGSKKVGSVEYAQAVLVLKSEKSWVFVQAQDDESLEGWLPASALTSKKIKEKAKAASADADELALAGKGFNSTIETVYAEQFEVSFEVVDYIETLSSNDEEAVIFAREGQLNDGGAE